MNMQELGYYLYMEQQEKQQKERIKAANNTENGKVNVDLYKYLVGEKTTQNK